MDLYGLVLRNFRTFLKAGDIGFDYILNPETSELHFVTPLNFLGPHHLSTANLDNFIGLTNVGIIPSHAFEDGTPIPVYDLATGECLGTYILNKCSHCRFPVD